MGLWFKRTCCSSGNFDEARNRRRYERKPSLELCIYRRCLYCIIWTFRIAFSCRCNRYLSSNWTYCSNYARRRFAQTYGQKEQDSVKRKLKRRIVLFWFDCRRRFDGRSSCNFDSCRRCRQNRSWRKYSCWRKTCRFCYFARCAYVPLAEMFGYSTELRSATQGRGNYSMFFERYEQCPKSVQEKVLSAKNAN